MPGGGRSARISAVRLAAGPGSEEVEANAVTQQRYSGQDGHGHGRRCVGLVDEGSSLRGGTDEGEQADHRGDDHATVTGQMFDPHSAREAGLLDAVVPPTDLHDRAQSAAAELSSIDRGAHAATKLRVRAPVLQELQRAIETELAEPSAAT